MTDLVKRIDKLLAIDASPEAWCIGANVLLRQCKAEIERLTTELDLAEGKLIYQFAQVELNKIEGTPI